MGRPGGKRHSLVSPTPAQGLRSLCLGPKARASSAHRLGEAAHISLPTPGLTVKRPAGAQTELFLKVPLALGGPGPQGSERRVGTVPHPHHGDLEGPEAFQVSGASEPRRQELLDAPPTQPAPEDQGRWSSKEAGKGWEQAEYKAHISRSPSLAEQPPEAWPKITPR